MTLRTRTRRVRLLLPAAGLCLAAAFAPFTALADTNLDIGGNGMVAYANGDNVRVRVAPGPDEAILGEVSEGSSVYVVDGLFTAADGSLWYQVEASGISGYMVADYLAREGGAGGPTGDAVATEQVYVRMGPSTADTILGTLSAGDQVMLTGAVSNGFYEIWYGDYVGYAYADYISPGGSAPAVVEEAPAQPSSNVSATGAVGTYYTTNAVNLRTGASTSDRVIAVVPASTEVSLTGNISNGFSEVQSGYGGGWIATDYLGGSPPAAPAAPQASSGGQAIVDFAMQFQGYPYVWAGNTPSGFDCSGFTQYVVQNTLGIDITHSTELQMSYGSSVGWGAWQPGDLIYFTGTYEGGWITHTGVYIGDGLMIHAENESTGVKISDITSGYYANHYYAAIRLV